MSNVLDIQIVGNVLVISTDTNPTSGGGTPAPVGSIAICEIVVMCARIRAYFF